MNVPFQLMRDCFKHPATVEYVKGKYPTEWGFYERFSEVNGPDCPFARASLKRICAAEFQEFRQEFLTQLESGTWGQEEA